MNKPHTKAWCPIKSSNDCKSHHRPTRPRFSCPNQASKSNAAVCARKHVWGFMHKRTFDTDISIRLSRVFVTFVLPRTESSTPPPLSASKQRRVICESMSKNAEAHSTAHTHPHNTQHTSLVCIATPSSLPHHSSSRKFFSFTFTLHLSLVFFSNSATASFSTSCKHQKVRTRTNTKTKPKR